MKLAFIAALAASVACAQSIDFVTQVKRKPFVDVRDYVRGGGVINQTVIQAAITAATTGQEVRVPRGAVLSGTGTAYTNGTTGSYLINLNKSIKLKCEGPIQVAASVGATVDAIFIGSQSGTLVDAHLDGCGVYPVSGTPGRYGIHVDATSTSNGTNLVKNLTVENLGVVGPFGDYGIKLNFPTYTDGIFNSVFRNLGYVYNGINCERCGDNLEFDGGTILGKYGFRVKLVFGAGNFKITGFSFVSCAPAITLVQASGVVIERNVIETNIAADASCTLQDGQVLIQGIAGSNTWDGQSGAAVGNAIIHNSFVAISNTVKYNIVLDAYSKGTIIRDNKHGLGGFWDAPTNLNPQKGLWIKASATDYFVEGDYLDYVTDWTLYMLNQSVGNGNVQLRHDGYLNLDGPFMIRPNGYNTWVFESNYLEQKAGLPFASLPSATSRTTITWCTDCNVATPCTGGGSGAWAFSNGSQWKCPF